MYIFSKCYFNSKVIIGLVGKLLLFCPASEGGFLYYFYGDPMEWSIGYSIFLDQNKNKYYVKACDFMFLKKFNEFKMYDDSNSSERFEHTFLFIKKNLTKSEEEDIFYFKNETIDIYIYSENFYNSSIKKYKEAIKLHYNTRIAILWKDTCRNRKLDNEDLLSDNNYLLSIADRLNADYKKKFIKNEK